MTEKELREIHESINDTWKFIKKYSEVSNSPNYWADVTFEAEEIKNKHNGSGFIKGLLVESVRELDRIRGTKYGK